MHDRILFVIRNHLEMSRYANKFDLEDPEVIDSFAQFIEESNDYAFSMFTPFAMQTLPLLTYGRP